MTGPLAGVRVLELAGMGAAPFAGMVLGDMGADVVLVDRPSGLSSPPDEFNLMRRNKRSRTLDLKNDQDLATFTEWVADADVLIEGYRPGVMERLGLGPDELLSLNSRLVYARVTGWGQDGPLAHKAGHDINYVALTGALNAIGSASSGPVPPLSLIGDFGGGGMFGAYGIVCALLERSSSGYGQVVDASMFDGAATLMAAFYALRQRGEWSLDRESNRTDGAAPFYGTFRTADDKYVAVGALEDKFYADLVSGLGLAEELSGASRAPESWHALKQRFAQVFATRTRDEWTEAFAGVDACVSPVLTMDEAWSSSHAIARGTFVEIAGVVHPAPAPRFSRTQGAIRGAPGTGCDTDAPAWT